MKNENGKSVSRACVLRLFVAAAIMLIAASNTATAKSLYVIGDVKGSTADATQPVHAYDIGVDGTLTFQAQHNIPHRMLGGVGLAIDSDSGYLFVSYEASDEIGLIDGTTMTGVGRVMAADASDLAGIVYDHTKKLLYCSDRGRDKLYVYNWDAKTVSLERVVGSPFTLRGASAFGIALDEIDGLLYVANGTEIVNVYSTSDWSRVNQIELSRKAIGIAVDVMNGYMYTGGAWVGNNYLTQYNIAKGTEAEVEVEPDAGVMGVGVDSDTGLIYMSTGKNNAPGGDNLLTYDMQLNLVGKIHIGGNSAGLAIPGKDIGFNPFNLTKELISGASDNSGPAEMPTVSSGDTITYRIGFSTSNDFTVTGVSIVDVLPRNVTFISADDEGVNGRYDGKSHSFRWTYSDLPPGTSTRLDLTVQVNKDVASGTIISNSVTINSNETPPTTTKLDILALSNSLNLTKTIVGAAGGEVTKVDPNDLISYQICFDNADNDFDVTEILLIDTLPPELTFISADNGKGSGYYDPKSHTYSWTPNDMSPGSARCVNLVARVNPDLAPGTLIRNSAIIDSNETPASMVTNDAITSFKALSISKSIVGATEGKLTLVGTNEQMTYLICFKNNSTTETVTGVSVVDSLPNNVTFVKAQGDGAFGQYDPKGHTYTWTYPSLPPNAKSPTCVELTVQVNKDVPPATRITNTVSITSNETPSETVSVDASTHFNPLDLNKIVVGGFGGEIEWVSIGETFIYGICYENDNDFAVTNVSIVDMLPKQVSFVTADDDGVFGYYDPNTHTYQWLYPSLAAKASVCLNLMVRVNPDVAPGTIISNTASIDSNETVPTPTGTSVDVTAEHPVILGPDGQGGYVSVEPYILRDNNSTNDLLVTIELPEGFEKDIIDITKEIRAVYSDPDTGIDYMVPAKAQLLIETASPAKILAGFDRAKIMEILPGQGEFRLAVKGRYKEKGSFRSYRGEVTVYVIRFAGG